MQKQTSILFNGYRFYKNGKYYTNKYGEGLHRAIWASVWGPIPAGMHVHHKNGDHDDNSIENLEILSPHDHFMKHASEIDAMARQRRDVVCAECGVLFSGGRKAAFCSQCCYNLNYRRAHPSSPKYRPPVECQWCGSTFSPHRNDKYCSKKCRYASSNARRRLENQAA